MAAVVATALVLLPTAGAAKCTPGTIYYPDGYEPSYEFQGECPQWKVDVGAKWMDWGDDVEVEGDIVGNYTVEVAEFDVDEVSHEVRGVLVEVYDSDTGEKVARGFYKEGGATRYVNYRDDLRVIIWDVRDAEADGTKWEREEVRAQAKVTVETRGLPDPDVASMAFSKEEGFGKKVDEVFSASKFWSRVKFKNEGDAKLFDTELSVNVSGFEVVEVKDGAGELDEDEYGIAAGTLSINYADVEERVSSSPDGRLGKDETYTLKLKLEAPMALQEKDVPLEGGIRGVDLKGDRYRASSSEDLRVYSVVNVFKDVAPDINPDTDQFEMYIGQEFTVTLRIRNFAETPVTVNELKDGVPKSFSLPVNQTLVWSDIEVGPESSTVVSYKLMPQATGTVDIPHPGANFTWKAPGVASTQVSVEKVVIGSGTTHGPLVKVEKTLSPSTLDLGENGTVTVEVKNEGDRAAQVKLTDSVPEGLSAPGELPARSEVLRGGESFSSTYEVRGTEEGNLTLPAAEVVYKDILGTKWRTFSGKPILRVERIVEETDEGGGPKGGSGGPTPTETPVTPGVGALSLLGIAAAAFSRR